MDIKMTSLDQPPVALEESCQVFVFNPTLVEKIKGELPDVTVMAALFKTLGDESRCVILMSLMQGNELCVCDLSQITGLAMPTVSHHLRKLREQGLVTSRREGKLVFYRLEGDHAKTLLQVATVRDHTKV